VKWTQNSFHVCCRARTESVNEDTMK
jgi:hypothetical protein